MAAYTDAGTISSKTTPSGTDVLYADAATVTTTTTPSTTEQINALDSAIITTTTTLIEIGAEVNTKHLTAIDYNGSSLTQTVTYDGSYTFAGSAGPADNDNGQLS